MCNKKIEIDTLSEQIETLFEQMDSLLDLMRKASDSVEIKSIIVASEMLFTIFDALKCDIYKLTNTINSRGE